MSVIRELVKPLSVRQGLLMYLDYTASKLKEIQQTNDPKIKDNAVETEKYLLNKIKQLGKPKKLEDLYRTREGTVIRAFEKLYAIYGTTLAKELDKISVPLNFHRILNDRNTYLRFTDFYDVSIATRE
jgi:hypothetical protein